MTKKVKEDHAIFRKFRTKKKRIPFDSPVRWLQWGAELTSGKFDFLIQYRSGKVGLRFINLPFKPVITFYIVRWGDWKIEYISEEHDKTAEKWERLTGKQALRRHEIIGKYRWLDWITDKNVRNYLISWMNNGRRDILVMETHFGPGFKRHHCDPRFRHVITLYIPFETSEGTKIAIISINNSRSSEWLWRVLRGMRMASYLLNLFPSRFQNTLFGKAKALRFKNSLPKFEFNLGVSMIWPLLFFGTFSDTNGSTQLTESTFSLSFPLPDSLSDEFSGHQTSSGKKEVAGGTSSASLTYPFRENVPPLKITTFKHSTAVRQQIPLGLLLSNLFFRTSRRVEIVAAGRPKRIEEVEVPRSKVFEQLDLKCDVQKEFLTGKESSIVYHTSTGTEKIREQKFEPTVKNRSTAYTRILNSSKRSQVTANQQLIDFRSPFFFYSRDGDIRKVDIRLIS